MKRINLEDFIKGKLEKGSFPYREGAWEQAAEQFAAWDAARRRKRRFVFLLLPILAACFIFAWQLWPADNSHENLVTQDTFAHASILPTTISNPYSSLNHSPSLLDALNSEMPSAKAKQTFETASKNSKPKKTNTPFYQSTTAEKPKIGEKGAQTLASIILTEEEVSVRNPIEEISFKEENVLPNSRISPMLYANGNTPFKRLSPYFEVGYAVFKSFTNETLTTSEWAGSPTLGTGVLYRLNRNLRLKVGLQYAYRTHLNHSLNRKETAFDFVRQNKDIWWTPEKLHYLYLPLEIQLRTTAKQRFLVGGQLAYLLGTEGSLLIQNANFYAPTQEPEKQVAPSYVTGISLFDASMHAGYELRISPRWGAAARYHWGLIDVMNDDIFKVNGLNRNSRLSFFMTYNF
jgi:hypothetical protein